MIVICLLPNCSYLSEVTRMLEIHRALAKRGVPSQVATHGGLYEGVLDAAGIAYDIIGPRMTRERSVTLVHSAVGVGSVTQSMYTDAELRTYAAAEAAYFRTHGVSAAVTGFTLTALLSTRLAGIPLVTEHAGCWVPPTFERGLIPAPSQPLLPLYVPSPLIRRLLNWDAQRAQYYTSGFNRVAAELGVERVPSTAALLMGDLTLVPEIPEILGIPAEDLAAWRPNGRPAYRPGTRLQYVGPLYARLDLPLAPDVAEFLDRPGPAIYVAITSSDIGLVRDVVAGLAPLDARILVAATVHDLADLASERVMVADVLPSHLVMPEVDLAVTAGGQGSVQTAMAAGTPLIGVPLQPEQDLNISLVERQGAARRLSKRHARTAKVATLATTMLSDDGYRREARRIQRIYTRVDGPANAADAIASLAA